MTLHALKEDDASLHCAFHLLIIYSSFYFWMNAHLPPSCLSVCVCLSFGSSHDEMEHLTLSLRTHTEADNEDYDVKAMLIIVISVDLN